MKTSTAKGGASQDAGLTEAREEAFFPYAFSEHKLENGLEVRFIPIRDGSSLVSYWTVVRTGSRDEVEEGVTGFAHFFEHMMFRGSKRYPAKAYDNMVNQIGAHANAYTTDDLTAYHMAFAAEDLGTVIDIEADRFLHLDYDEAAFKTEAGAVYGEFRKGRTSPWSVLYEGLLNAAFVAHSYQHTTIGFEEDVMNMPNQYDYSKTFFDRFYRPENVVLMVVGDFQPEPTLELIKKHYGAWESGYEAPLVPKEPEQTALKRVDLSFPGKTLPMLAIFWKGDAFRPEDPTMVAGSILGELAFGQVSPIYKKLILDEQSVDMLSPSFGWQRDPKLWGTFVSLKDPEEAAKVERQLVAAMEVYQDILMDEDSLKAVLQQLYQKARLRLDSGSSVAGFLARPMALTKEISQLNLYYETLLNLKPEDIMRAANRYFTRGRLTVARLSTEGESLPEPFLKAGEGPKKKGDSEVEARVLKISKEKEEGRSPDEGPDSAQAEAQEKANVLLMDGGSTPVLSLKARFNVGSQDDPKGKEGLALLTASLMVEGDTEKRSYAELLEKLYLLGGEISMSLDKEMTVFSLRTAPGNEAAEALFYEALREPKFSEADFQRVKSELLSYLEKTLRYSSDEELGKAVLYAEVFQNTPYAHPMEGLVSSLKAISLEDVKAFYKTQFTKEHLLLGKVAAHEEAAEEALSRRYFDFPSSSLDPKEGASKAAFQLPKVEGRQLILTEKPGPSTAISFGWPIALKRGSRDFYALDVARAWLGEHRNSFSHLYQVIREKRGMNYGNYAYIEAFPRGGWRTLPPTGVGRQHQLAEIWIRPVPEDQAAFALKAAMREVELLYRNGLTQEEFELARDFTQKHALQYAQNPERKLGYAMDDEFYGLNEQGQGHLAKIQKILPTLTLEEVNAAIKTYFNPENLVISMVTENANEMAKTLLSNQIAKIRYPEGLEKPKAILEEDQIIGAWPLALKKENVRIQAVDSVFE